MCITMRVHGNKSFWQQHPHNPFPHPQKDKKSSPKNKQLWEGGTYFTYLKTHILEDYLI